MDINKENYTDIKVEIETLYGDYIKFNKNKKCTFQTKLMLKINLYMPNQLKNIINIMEIRDEKNSLLYFTHNIKNNNELYFPIKYELLNTNIIIYYTSMLDNIENNDTTSIRIPNLTNFYKN